MFSPNPTLINATVTGNRANNQGTNTTGNEYGGGLHIGGNTNVTTLKNTIVSGNFSGTGSTAAYYDDQVLMLELMSLF